MLNVLIVILNFGESFDYNANTVGEFPFYCSLHVWMQGVLIVQEAERIGSERIAQEEQKDTTLWFSWIFDWLQSWFQ